MTPCEVADIYRTGDMPFRPRQLSRLFALRWAMRSPVHAVKVARAMPNDATRSRFELELEIYADSPMRWVYHEIWMKRPFRPKPPISDNREQDGSASLGTRRRRTASPQRNFRVSY